MTAIPREADNRVPALEPAKSYVGPSGIIYPTTKFHWYAKRLVICPACNCGPCPADCPEQAIPDRRPL